MGSSERRDQRSDDTGQPSQETLTRNWDELLQEIRVTQTGVQILTGFLLTVPFSSRFGDLTNFQRMVYLAVLAGSVVTTGLVVAPVASSWAVTVQEPSLPRSRSRTRWP